jgi:hypothetical protein
VSLLYKNNVESRTRRGKSWRRAPVALCVMAFRCFVKRSLESSIRPKIQTIMVYIIMSLYVTFNTIRLTSFNGNCFGRKALKSVRLRTQNVEDKWLLWFCNVRVTGPSQ